MSFYDRNRLGAEVQFVILVRLDESWKVDLILCPKCVISEVQEGSCGCLHIPRVGKHAHIPIGMFGFVQLEKLCEFPSYLTLASIRMSRNDNELSLEI